MTISAEELDDVRGLICAGLHPEAIAKLAVLIAVARDSAAMRDAGQGWRPEPDTFSDWTVGRDSRNRPLAMVTFTDTEAGKQAARDFAGMMLALPPKPEASDD